MGLGDTALDLSGQASNVESDIKLGDYAKAASDVQQFDPFSSIRQGIASLEAAFGTC